jgi:CHASE3 domain sensor protein
MCLQTGDSATLKTLVESKDSFKALMEGLRDMYKTREPAKVPVLLGKISSMAPLANWRQLPELIPETL